MFDEDTLFPPLTILLALILIAMLCGLAGCSGLSQAVAAKAASDKIAIEAANDTIVAGIKNAIVALPYGALVRHPEMQSCAKSIAGAPGVIDLFAPLATPAAAP